MINSNPLQIIIYYYLLSIVLFAALAAYKMYTDEYFKEEFNDIEPYIRLLAFIIAPISLIFIFKILLDDLKGDK